MHLACILPEIFCDAASNTSMSAFTDVMLFERQEYGGYARKCVALDTPNISGVWRSYGIASGNKSISCVSKMDFVTCNGLRTGRVWELWDVFMNATSGSESGGIEFWDTFGTSPGPMLDQNLTCVFWDTFWDSLLTLRVLHIFPVKCVLWGCRRNPKKCLRQLWNINLDKESSSDVGVAVHEGTRSKTIHTGNQAVGSQEEN